MKPLLIFVSLVLCAALCGCGSSSSSGSSDYGTPTSPTTPDIAVSGVYTVYSLTPPQSSAATTCPGSIGAGYSCGSSDTIVFYSSVIDANDDNVTETPTGSTTPRVGSYTVSGNTVTVNWSSPSEIQTYTASWSGNSQSPGSTLILSLQAGANLTTAEVGETVTLLYTGASPSIKKS